MSAGLPGVKRQENQKPTFNFSLTVAIYFTLLLHWYDSFWKSSDVLWRVKNAVGVKDAKSWNAELPEQACLLHVFIERRKNLLLFGFNSHDMKARKLIEADKIKVFVNLFYPVSLKNS